MMSKIAKLKSKVKSLSSEVKSYTRRELLGQILPIKPHTLNLLANDVCNSRCQMCLIWQNKKDVEYTPDELAKILEDDLFSELKYVGVSGGEPTLRPDLPEIYRVLCQKKPRILATGIITNGIIENAVKERVLKSAEICRSHGVSFNVMVSLDGLGEVHDTVRGRKNNFQTAISLIKFFHEETKIPTSFGCTITDSNALYVDELMDYAQEKRIYGRFRIAEFIDRLYNEGQTEHIRAFNEKMRYHLGLFFFRAEHGFETNAMYQKTYRNIRGMLIEGKEREIGCPYQADAVVLTARGEILYCAPKSPILGNALQQSASQLYRSNIEKRKEIIKNDCKDCIHDYHVPPTIVDKISDFWQSKRKELIYNYPTLFNQASGIIKNSQGIEDPISLSSQKALIVGWYGTETVGDKAIVWDIIERLKNRPNPPKTIYLSSLFPFISHWTVKEMNFENVEVVETYSPAFEKACLAADEIIMGGGPLMDLEVLDHILYAFIKGAKRQAINRVDGCGIGPLVNPRYIQAVSEIMRLADHVTLRDIPSTQRAKKEFGVSYAKTVPDPATGYVLAVKSQLDQGFHSSPPLGTQPNIACFLREWSMEYAGGLDRSGYLALRKQFEFQLQKMVLFIADYHKLDVHLMPMHSFFVGGDDRIFNRKLAKVMEQELEDKSQQFQIRFAREPISPVEIATTMYHAKFNICMRFHSVLFAENLGVPYLAIDYTRGGKIKAFLEAKGQQHRLIGFDDLAGGKWKEQVIQLLKHDVQTIH